VLAMAYGYGSDGEGLAISRSMTGLFYRPDDRLLQKTKNKKGK
jgi:hypothetical protein